MFSRLTNRINPLPPHLDPRDDAGQANRQQWMSRLYILAAIGLIGFFFLIQRFRHAPAKPVTASLPATPAPMDDITMEKTALELQEKGDFAAAEPLFRQCLA